MYMYVNSEQGKVYVSSQPFSKEKAALNVKTKLAI